ncbi:hypothetical protein ccbrp13_44700 [Ktedonobacteria bacterium brp13]|nr:hypothetical protein ccbrp13_44700 [Ktedonobacteria bacterium brp13]
MSDIVQELTIEATPENVFHALVLPDGMVAYKEKHTRILLHMRGGPMTLPDRIERTLANIANAINIYNT